MKISSCGDLSKYDINAPNHKGKGDRMNMKNQTKQDDSVQLRTSESALKFTLQMGDINLIQVYSYSYNIVIDRYIWV